MEDPVFLNTFDYFDPVNLAPWLRAPTLVSSGGKDETCPPAAIRAVFDRLPGIKSLTHYPDLAHTSAGDFYEMSWEWMQRYV
jgi:cephalosporin-C deacetylase-like acetyl esterase